MKPDANTQKKFDQADASRQDGLFEDEFLSSGDLVTVNRDLAEKRRKRAFADLEELIREKKWEDAISLYYPVDEKFPELMAFGLETVIREKMGFILGQVKRFDEAVAELEKCIQVEPDNFYTRGSLAYTAYNSLYAAKNRELVLTRDQKQARIAMAHENFQKACELRPDTVTNYYRRGMLCKQIEDKPERAMPFFEKAVENWQGLDTEAREKRHQERKNYIKALFQLASCRLNANDPVRALELMRECLAEDEKSNYLAMVFKYFALGKIHFHSGSFAEARDALLFAAQCGKSARQPVDYVHELLARTYLAMGHAQKALETINKEPENRRRPYFRWTEADVLCALNKFDQACNVLKKSLERDGRSRHKSLIRLAKIAYARRDFHGAGTHAAEADRFFRQKWNNPCLDALFWGSLAAFRTGNNGEARRLAQELKSHAPHYPKLASLLEKVGA
jgi:tetratricopeptide (TPR) repeat protein